MHRHGPTPFPYFLFYWYLFGMWRPLKQFENKEIILDKKSFHSTTSTVLRGRWTKPGSLLTTWKESDCSLFLRLNFVYSHNDLGKLIITGIDNLRDVYHPISYEIIRQCLDSNIDKIKWSLFCKNYFRLFFTCRILTYELAKTQWSYR